MQKDNGSPAASSTEALAKVDGEAVVGGAENKKAISERQI